MKDGLAAVALLILIGGWIWLAIATNSGPARRADIQQMQRQIEERCR